jgi:hypothetical protein
MTERLLLLAETPREHDRFELDLLHMRSDEIHRIYQRQEPKLIAKGERFKRLVRRQERRAAMVARLQSDEAWFADRARRWTHPSIQYPLAPPPPSRPVLGFGLEELYEAALWLWLHKGNQDAAATCRMIGAKPARSAIPAGYEVAPPIRGQYVGVQAVAAC